MRIAVQILSVWILIGISVAQSTPAPKNQSNSQPSKVQKGTNTANGPVKNPFTPKTAAKPQAPAKQSASTHGQTVSPKKSAPVTAKATPTPKRKMPAEAQPALAVAQSSTAKLPDPGKR